MSIFANVSGGTSILADVYGGTVSEDTISRYDDRNSDLDAPNGEMESEVM